MPGSLTNKRAQITDTLRVMESNYDGWTARELPDDSEETVETDTISRECSDGNIYLANDVFTLEDAHLMNIEEDLDICPLSIIPEFNDERLLSDFLYNENKSDSLGIAQYLIENSVGRVETRDIARMKAHRFDTCTQLEEMKVTFPSSVKKEYVDDEVRTRPCRSNVKRKLPTASASVNDMNLSQKPSQFHQLKRTSSLAACCPGHASSENITQKIYGINNRHKLNIPLHDKMQSEILPDRSTDWFQQELPGCSKKSRMSNGQNLLASPQTLPDSPDISRDKIWFLINNKFVDFEQVEEIFRAGESMKKLKKQIEVYRHIVQYSDLLSAAAARMLKGNTTGQDNSVYTVFLKKNYLSLSEVLGQSSGVSTGPEKRSGKTTLNSNVRRKKKPCKKHRLCHHEHLASTKNSHRNKSADRQTLRRMSRSEQNDDRKCHCLTPANSPRHHSRQRLTTPLRQSNTKNCKKTWREEGMSREDKTGPKGFTEVVSEEGENSRDISVIKKLNAFHRRVPEDLRNKIIDNRQTKQSDSTKKQNCEDKPDSNPLANKPGEESDSVDVTLEKRHPSSERISNNTASNRDFKNSGTDHQSLRGSRSLVKCKGSRKRCREKGGHSSGGSQSPDHKGPRHACGKFSNSPRLGRWSRSESVHRLDRQWSKERTIRAKSHYERNKKVVDLHHKTRHCSDSEKRTHLSNRRASSVSSGSASNLHRRGSRSSTIPISRRSSPVCNSVRSLPRYSSMLSPSFHKNKWNLCGNRVSPLHVNRLSPFPRDIRRSPPCGNPQTERRPTSHKPHKRYRSSSDERDSSADKRVRLTKKGEGYETNLKLRRNGDIDKDYQDGSSEGRKNGNGKEQLQQSNKTNIYCSSSEIEVAVNSTDVGLSMFVHLLENENDSKETEPRTYIADGRTVKKNTLDKSGQIVKNQQISQSTEQNPRFSTSESMTTEQTTKPPITNRSETGNRSKRWRQTETCKSWSRQFPRNSARSKLGQINRYGGFSTSKGYLCPDCAREEKCRQKTSPAKTVDTQKRTQPYGEASEIGRQGDTATERQSNWNLRQMNEAVGKKTAGKDLFRPGSSNSVLNGCGKVREKSPKKYARKSDCHNRSERSSVEIHSTVVKRGSTHRPSPTRSIVAENRGNEVGRPHGRIHRDIAITGVTAEGITAMEKRVRCNNTDVKDKRVVEKTRSVEETTCSLHEDTEFVEEITLPQQDHTYTLRNPELGSSNTMNSLLSASGRVRVCSKSYELTLIDINTTVAGNDGTATNIKHPIGHQFLSSTNINPVIRNKSYDNPCIIDLPETSANSLLGSDSSARITEKSIYMKIQKNVLASGCPEDPRVQLVKNVNLCLLEEVDSDNVKNEQEGLRVSNGQPPLGTKTILHQGTNADIQSITNSHGVQPQSDSSCKDVSDIRCHFTDDKVSTFKLDQTYNSGEDAAAEILTGSSRTKEIEKNALKTTRHPAKLPPLSDPIIASRLSKEQTMDILDEFCNVVRPLSPLPEEDGDHLHVKRSANWVCSGGNGPCAVKGSPDSESLVSGLVKGIKRLGACSVSVPCASAIQYEICGIRIVQLFGTPPNLQLQPAHDSGFPSITCKNNMNPLLNVEMKKENNSPSLSQMQCLATHKRKPLSFQSHCNPGTAGTTAQTGVQPSSLEKLCICSLKKNSEFLTDWTRRKRRLPDDFRTEINTEHTSKFLKYNNGSDISPTSVVSELNRNNNHGPDETNAMLDGYQIAKLHDTNLDLTESATGPGDFLCDTMNTPIVLSAMDRVYHVSSGTHEHDLPWPNNGDLMSQKSFVGAGVEDDNNGGGAFGKTGDSGDLLSKAMECAGLTEAVIDKFLRSDYTIESFIMNNQPPCESVIMTSDADVFLDTVLHEHEHVDSGVPIHGEAGASSLHTDSYHTPKISLTTQPSMSLAGCSSAPSFSLNDAVNVEQGWESNSVHQFSNDGIHSNMDGCLCAWDNLGSHDPDGENMPSISQIHGHVGPVTQSFNTLVSFEDGRLVEGSPNVFCSHLPPLPLHSQDYSTSESASHQDLTMLRPVVNLVDNNMIPGHWSECSLTNDPATIKEAIDMIPFIEDLDPEQPVFSETGEQENHSLQKTDGPRNQLSQKSVKPNAPTAPTRILREKKGKECRPVRTTCSIGLRRRELVQACLDRDIVPYAHASTRRHITLNTAAHKGTPILEIPPVQVKTKPLSVPFEARSLICIDNDRQRGKPKGTRTSGRQKPTQETANSKRQTKKKKRNTQRKIYSQPQKQQHQHVPKKTSSTDSKLLEPNSAFTDPNSGRKEMGISRELIDMTGVAGDLLNGRKRTCRKSKALCKYYENRQAAVNKFTRQLSISSPGLLKHVRAHTEWRTYHKVNQISTKILCPLRLSKSKRRTRACAGNEIRVSQYVETNTELNCNNNADPNVIRKIPGVKEENRSKPQLQQRGEKLPQRQKQKLTKESFGQERPRQIKKLQDQLERKESHDKRLRDINEKTTDIKETQKNLKNIHHKLVKNYSKMYEAPRTSSFSTILGQNNQNPRNKVALFPTQASSLMHQDKLRSVREKSSLFPDIASQSDSLVNRSQDKDSHRLKTPEREKVSVLKFVQRLDTSYGDQLTKGNPETKTRLNKLCDRYLSLHGNRRHLAKRLQPKPDQKPIPRKLDNLPGKCSNLHNIPTTWGIDRNKDANSDAMTKLNSQKSEVKSSKKEESMKDNSVAPSQKSENEKEGVENQHPSDDVNFSENNEATTDPASKTSAPQDSISIVAKAQEQKATRKAKSQKAKKPPSVKPLKPEIARIVNRLSARPPSPNTKLLHKIHSWEHEYGKPLTVIQNTRALNKALPGGMFRPMVPLSERSSRVHHPKDFKTSKPALGNKKPGAHSKLVNKIEHGRSIAKELVDQVAEQTQSVIPDPNSVKNDLSTAPSDTEEFDVKECIEKSGLLNLPSMVNEKADEKIDAPELAASARSGTPNSVEELYLTMQSEYYKNMHIDTAKHEVESQSSSSEDEEPAQSHDALGFGSLSPLNPILPEESPFSFLNLVDQPPVEGLSENPVRRDAAPGYRVRGHVKFADMTKESAPETEDQVTGNSTDLHGKGQTTDTGYSGRDTADYDLGPEEDDVKYIANIAEPYFSGHTKEWTVQGVPLPSGYGGDSKNNYENDRYKAQERCQNARKKRDERKEREAMEASLTLGSPCETPVVGARDIISTQDGERNKKNDGSVISTAAHDSREAESRIRDSSANRASRNTNKIGDEGETDPAANDLETTIATAGCDDMANRAKKDMDGDTDSDHLTEHRYTDTAGYAKTRVDTQTDYMYRKGGHDLQQMMSETPVTPSRARSCLTPMDPLGGGDNVGVADQDKWLDNSMDSDTGDESQGEDPDFESLESLKKSVDMSLAGEFRYVPYLGMHFVQHNEKPNVNFNRLKLDNEEERMEQEKFREMFQIGRSGRLSPILESHGEEEELERRLEEDTHVNNMTNLEE